VERLAPPYRPVCLALIFTLKACIAQAESLPPLSVRDIAELLEIYPPGRSRAPAEVLAVMSRLHQARQKAVDFAQKNRRKPRNNLTK
jgi:hypothetical protein